jgi:hypothetical protein
MQQPSIKRRRKKRRLSTTSSSEHNPEIFANPSIQIKQEKETDGSAVENNAEHSENSSDVPMNLSHARVTEQNAVTSSTQQQNDSEVVKSLLKNKLTSTAIPEVSPVVPPVIEQKQEEHQLIFCKKVRQAQQMKMSANANVSASVVAPCFPSPSITIEPPGDVASTSKLERRSKVTRRIRKLQEEAAAQSGQAGDEQEGPLKEDFILPRERFISICNMDRNALDTYLNNSEENSQDLELLQYFDKPNEDTIEEDLGPATTSVPLLENYHLNFNDNKNDKQDKINQLRTILEERHSGMLINDSPAIKSLLLKDPPTQMSMMEQSDVQSSYSMQNYSNIEDKMEMVPQSPNTRRKNFSFVPISTQSRVVKNVNLMPAFSSSNNNNSNMRQDSFVSPRVTPIHDRRSMQQGLNIRSPSSMSLEVAKNVNNCNRNVNNVPVLGVNNNTAFCRPSQFKIEPVSAPPSPSMAPHFNFSPQAQPHQQNHFQFQTLSAHVQGEENSQKKIQNFLLIFQFSQSGTNTNNFNFPVESRSQSVPPHHCSNSSNGLFNNYVNYSQSACNSVANTPVPSDYQEFTNDTNILDIFNNEQPPLPSVVKMESNDDVINDLLDNELLNQNDSNTSDGTSVDAMSMRQSNFNSRSVPTSPYQAPQGNGYNNGLSSNCCPLGKSVPNTPITTTSNPFRYSPGPELQRTRDFLINGFNQQNLNHNNNVIGCKMNNKLDANIQHHQHTTDIADVLDSNNLLGNI